MFDYGRLVTFERLQSVSEIYVDTVDRDHLGDLRVGRRHFYLLDFAIACLILHAGYRRSSSVCFHASPCACKLYTTGRTLNFPLVASGVERHSGRDDLF
jgi:hypothetical protein